MSEITVDVVQGNPINIELGVEADPVWKAQKGNYYTNTESDSKFADISHKSRHYAAGADALNLNDLGIAADVSLGLYSISTLKKISSPNIDKSYKTQSYIPIVTADALETPFYFERATSPMTTPTSDATGDCLHPDAVYIPGGWNGYRYWMVMTPFYHAVTALENPEILVSNDKVTWIDPGTNPIAPNPGGGYYNSDPCLMFENNTLYCYWRLGGVGDGDRILMKSSTDGITWSDSVTVYDAGGTTDGVVASPMVRNINGTYYLWTVDVSGDYPAATTMIRRSSTSPSGPFSNPTVCVLNTGAQEYIFHINILWDGDACYCIYKADGTGQSLFGRSYDNGINWDINGVPVAIVGTAGTWDYSMYQSCLIRRPGRNYFDVIYSAIDDSTPYGLHRIGNGKLHWPETDSANVYGYFDGTLQARYRIYKETSLKVDNTGGAFAVLATRSASTTPGFDPRIHFQAGATPSTKTTMGVDLDDGSKFKIAASVLASSLFNLDYTNNKLIIGFGAADVDYAFGIDGATNDFLATWMQAAGLDYLAVNDDILLNSTENIYFRDTAISINSATDGHLDLTADVSFDFNTATDTDTVLNFPGTTKSGVLYWMEDEGAFRMESAPLNTSWNNLTLDDLTPLAAGVGGGISFRGIYTGSTITTAGYIKASKTNATDADYSFDLDLYNRLTGGGIRNVMKLKNTGEVVVSSPTNTVLGSYTGLTINQKYNPVSNDATYGNTGIYGWATTAGANTALNVTGASIGGYYAGTGRVIGGVYGFTALAAIETGAAAGTTPILQAGKYKIYNNDADTIITSAEGIRILTPANSGTFTNTYGFYIESQTAGTQTNTAYGIYQAGAGDINYFAGDFSLAGGSDIILATSTGTKIATAANQLLGFYGATPVDQPATVADATDAASVILRCNDIIDRLQELGLIA